MVSLSGQLIKKLKQLPSGLIRYSFACNSRMTTFFQGDCLEVMKDLCDNSIDCFICDLPYGQLTSGYDRPGHNEEVKKKVSKQTNDCCSWDIKIDLVAFWEQVKRLAKNDHTPVLMFCNTKFGIDLINSNPSWFRYDLVWDKGHGVSFLLANKMPMKSHEMIYVFSKKGAFYRRVDVKTDKPDWGKDRSKENRKISTQYNAKPSATNGIEKGKSGLRCPLSVIPIDGKSAGGHPTEKPEELYEWLLRRYVPDGGTVLDPTAGSFNSCFVADRLGYVALGIEKDERFYEKAVTRLNPPPPPI
jgi:site-specific DNA-methyltransferase (adenine-specific)